MLAGPSAHPLSERELRELLCEYPDSRILQKNPFLMEAKLRSRVTAQLSKTEEKQIKIGSAAENGCSWEVSLDHGSWFVNRSDFYATPHRIGMIASACLYITETATVKVRLWSYMSVQVRCNGVCVGGISRPVYKPMVSQDLELHLQSGKNLLLFDCVNLGMRDTRNIFGMQVLDHREQITVALPDEAIQDIAFQGACMLDRTLVREGMIQLPPGADGKMYVNVKEPSVTVTFQDQGLKLSRKLELSDHILPQYELPENGQKNALNKAAWRIAKQPALDRGTFDFAIMNILARRYLSIQEPEDEQRLCEDLNLIEQRVDCADFLVLGLLRYCREYPVHGELGMMIKKVLCGFRYWMDMDGEDAMCFWSENHALIFFVCQLLAGELYPDEWFVRANMTGTELALLGRKNVLLWMRELEEYGAEEFLSGTYLSVTVAALCNLIDYGDEDISVNARKAADMILHSLALHSFQGTAIAPMGRTYRNVIYPFMQESQELLHLISPDAPFSGGEGWTAYLLTSSYCFPDDFKQLMNQPCSESWQSGNAQIVIQKSENYCLTSVLSEAGKIKRRWQNNRENQDIQSYEYIRSMNECFHGTTWFRPGVYGYQQHLWYAALSPEAVIFVNHPGCSSDDSGLRPGYWHGNGVMPALRQDGKLLLTIYCTGNNHPIHFTHLYCPRSRFDEIQEEEHWIFLRHAEGYIGLWHSAEAVPYQDVLFDCELRFYHSKTAFVCIVGSCREDGSFEQFIRTSRELKPEFDDQLVWLKAGQQVLQYQAEIDDTQYLD